MKKNSKLYKLMLKVLTRDYLIIKTFKDLGLEIKEESPFNVSFASELFLIMGLPEESDMMELYHKNYDELYTFVTLSNYGDITPEKAVSRILKYTKDMKLNKYNPKDHKKEIKSFLSKYSKLYNAVISLNSYYGVLESSYNPLNSVISDLSLVKSMIIGVEPEDFKLYSYLLECIRTKNFNSLIKKV